jgi:hypothetical protein
LLGNQQAEPVPANGHDHLLSTAISQPLSKAPRNSINSLLTDASRRFAWPHFASNFLSGEYPVGL